MTWHASLDLNYRLQEGKTTLQFAHNGPLRILQSLYPEGDAICHNVMVHPPGGLVGGDTLEIGIEVQRGAHALLTTPGATRFYRSAGEWARQQVHARLQEGGRLEWLPLEALAYSDCLAENRAVFELAEGAQVLGWDITALGLPAADQPFSNGQFLQHLELPGVWLERGLLDALDQRLMDSPLGLAGHRCMATLFFLSGSPIEQEQAQSALEAIRPLLSQPNSPFAAGATQAHPQVLVLRVLAPLVEPALDMLKLARSVWRERLWGLNAAAPRVWAT
jgi:urease accessory protein